MSKAYGVIKQQYYLIIGQRPTLDFGFYQLANAERLELEVKRLAGQLQEFRAPAAKSDQPHPNARLEPVELSKRNGGAKCNEEHS